MMNAYKPFLHHLHAGHKPNISPNMNLNILQINPNGELMISPANKLPAIRY
ncbi:hypothetical protein T12_6225 [Trichinella patagoniensis]|uniref:Uncharacterized protein n=1 Tax=Trichinella patagoniensis TaxID=990121 RepID=A0A0V0W5S2_9BILA|nr:hypothetical protein T12_6225 [Trichinella patagoniensis]